MIDHAQRIQNKREIEQMKSYIDPMLIAIAVALALIIGSVMLDKYAASKHGGEIKTAAAFAACLSGAQILVGDDGIANCRVVSSKLVNGL